MNLRIYTTSTPVIKYVNVSILEKDNAPRFDKMVVQVGCYSPGVYGQVRGKGRGGEKYHGFIETFERGRYEITPYQFTCSTF